MSDIPPYKVYGLIDPRDNRVFYVGMSYIVHSRVGAHNTDKKGSAYARCQEIICAGYKPSFCIFGIFEDGNHAAFLEGSLITAMRGLVNKTHSQERRDFWRLQTELAEAESEIEDDAIDIMMEAQSD